MLQLMILYCFSIAKRLSAKSRILCKFSRGAGFHKNFGNSNFYTKATNGLQIFTIYIGYFGQNAG